MLRAIVNNSWKQHPMKQQLHGYLSPISQTIQVRRTRHAGHCWRSKDELIRDLLLLIYIDERASVSWPPRTYLRQLCADTGCTLEDLPGAMNDRDGWREKVRKIRASYITWCWWWWRWCTHAFIYIYIHSYMYTHMYIHAYIHIYTHIYTYIYIDTQIHTVVLCRSQHQL